mmetsp:Transcript_21282/g.41457  ORF Transcript_21282/g.41457 Transcript_21282/m.41457 type:complete len:259 (-) Transcript_21282:124-900(-)
MMMGENMMRSVDMMHADDVDEEVCGGGMPFSLPSKQGAALQIQKGSIEKSATRCVEVGAHAEEGFAPVSQEPASQPRSGGATDDGADEAGEVFEATAHVPSKKCMCGGCGAFFAKFEAEGEPELTGETPYVYIDCSRRKALHRESRERGGAFQAKRLHSPIDIDTVVPGPVDGASSPAGLFGDRTLRDAQLGPRPRAVPSSIASFFGGPGEDDQEGEELTAESHSIFMDRTRRRMAKLRNAKAHPRSPLRPLHSKLEL